MLLVGKEGLSLLSLMLRSGKAQIIKICLNHSPSKVRESFQRKLRVVRTMNLASSCCRSPVRVEINGAVNLENQGLLRSKQLEISIFSSLPTSRPMYSGTVGWLPIWQLKVSSNLCPKRKPHPKIITRPNIYTGIHQSLIPPSPTRSCQKIHRVCCCLLSLRRPLQALAFSFSVSRIPFIKEISPSKRLTSVRI